MRFHSPKLHLQMTPTLSAGKAPGGGSGYTYPQQAPTAANPVIQDEAGRPMLDEKGNPILAN